MCAYATYIRPAPHKRTTSWRRELQRQGASSQRPLGWQPCGLKISALCCELMVEASLPSPFAWVSPDNVLLDMPLVWIWRVWVISTGHLGLSTLTARSLEEDPGAL